MEATPQDQGRARRLGVCIIIPTYNNCRTLGRVLAGVAAYSTDIIVVNDGSTDRTSAILDDISGPTRIDFHKNSGKGMALRAGFAKAAEMGYEYAITIDSDGQHFPHDISSFLDAVEDGGPALLIGSRNMSHENVPKKSSFGNRFSNFWFWFETGIRLTDTQSGFRLYPLAVMPKRFFTRKFEFEIEVIVRTAWKGVPVKNIPIEVLYDPEERVSHFRPFTDFTRISILNTILVLNMILYIRPRNFFLNLKKKGLRRFFVEHVLRNQDSDFVKSASIALGVFVGIAPIWGLQTVVVLFLATVFKLNRAIAFAFSNISIPPMIPFLIYGSLVAGKLFFPDAPPLDFHRLLSIDAIRENIAQYLVGSIILATVAALVFGGTAYLMMASSRTKTNN
ncbi:MAG: DUF2062 domain-containing protein [Flavobacterium sp.]|nr:MAG: DUF2062 domain-containing protein [Flavobacterium sp.]